MSTPGPRQLRLVKQHLASTGTTVLARLPPVDNYIFKPCTIPEHLPRRLLVGKTAQKNTWAVLRKVKITCVLEWRKRLHLAKLVDGSPRAKPEDYAIEIQQAEAKLEELRE
jgi:hypothetical protein